MNDLVPTLLAVAANVVLSTRTGYGLSQVTAVVLFVLTLARLR